MLFDNLYTAMTGPGTVAALLAIVGVAAAVVLAGSAAGRTPRASHRPLV